MELPNHAKQLLQQLNQQRSKGFFCDVIIVVENALFRAHKTILAASSVYFKSLVLHDNLINLDTDMVTASVFRQVLDFIYTGKVAAGELSAPHSLAALLTAASYLQLHDLGALCRKRIKRGDTKASGGGRLGPLPPPPQQHHRKQQQQQQAGLSNGAPGLGPEMLGLDLSKKSPPLSAHLLPEELPMQLGESEQASPTASASIDNHSDHQHRESSEGSAAATDTGQTSHKAYPRASVSASGRAWLKRERDEGDEDGGGGGGAEEEQRRRHKAAVGASGLAYRFEPAAYGDNLYVCIPCGKGFPSSEQLNTHVERHTEEELYIKEEVEDEEEAAGEAYAATQGPGSAGDTRPYRCSVCDKSYRDPATLRQHEKTHWLSRPFPCNICGKMFTQRGTMTRHMRSHLGLKPFACEECGMRFTRQYRLTEHMRVHSGEKPYECQVCGGKFTQQRNLISHMRMHTSPT
uniref:Hypermethylated in cancer 1 protein n=1 Tax=Callorhinchus milii TaxID=7868 RepID=A0A4W3JNC8_CALMI